MARVRCIRIGPFGLCWEVIPTFPGCERTLFRIALMPNYWASVGISVQVWRIHVSVGWLRLPQD